MKKKTTKKSTRGFNSITALMKDRLQGKAGESYTPEKAQKDVSKFFPGTRFLKDPAGHLSWYRSAFKRGALKGVR